jgi:hypothetical protein
MAKSVFAVLGFLAASSLAIAGANAAETACGKWETSFSSLAGEGEALNAHFCSEVKGKEFSFEITCTSGSLNIRFMPQIEGSGQEYDKVTLDYVIDGKSHVVQSQYEELDGAFAADVDAADPLVKAMKTARTATLTLKKTKAPAFTVPLAGAGRALGKLVRGCKS